MCIRTIFSERMRRDLIIARREALGPKELRTNKEPSANSRGVMEGGTAFERNLPTKIRGGRCYSLGLSCERPRKVVEPCKDGKVKNNDNASLKMRKKLITVSCSLSWSF